MPGAAGRTGDRAVAGEPRGSWSKRVRREGVPGGQVREENLHDQVMMHETEGASLDFFRKEVELCREQAAEKRDRRLNLIELAPDPR